MSKFEVAPSSRHHEISLGGRLLEREPSKHRSLRLHCGVERSLRARFLGDWPGSFDVIDVTNTPTDRQTDQQTDRQIRLV